MPRISDWDDNDEDAYYKWMDYNEEDAYYKWMDYNEEMGDLLYHDESAYVEQDLRELDEMRLRIRVPPDDDEDLDTLEICDTMSAMITAVDVAPTIDTKCATMRTLFQYVLSMPEFLRTHKGLRGVVGDRCDEIRNHSVFSVALADIVEKADRILAEIHT